VQVNRAEAAVKRTASTGYHGYRPILKAAIFYLFGVEVLLHVH
jgi:hypothetical protein